MLFAPGVGHDIDGVAVLGKAIDQGSDAGGAGKEGAPLLERQVGGDDDGARLVSPADDVEEQVCRCIVAGKIFNLVDDKKCWGGIAPESSFERRQGFGA